jgi:hypothetical protein
MRSAKENRTMGRPRISEPRRRQLNICLSESELANLERRARAVGMRTIHFSRALLLNPGKTPTSPSEQPTTNALVYVQLSRLGNNLNQLVRHLHQTGDPLPSDLEPLLRDIRQIIARARP